MKRLLGFALLGLIGCAGLGAAERMLGMYVHQHWPYNHPYAARTWTLDDWRGYADGLKKLGYNAVMIWPVIETMPDPLGPSDLRHMELTQHVIDMLHHEFGMKVWIALCPNVGPKSIEARKAPFEKRHFFYTDLRVNPADSTAVDGLIRARERIFRYLRNADAVSIIDSDPGGYPGSTNAEFVNLLVQHRRMLDRLRPGIELVYWMHAGWQAYSRYYQTGDFKRGTDEEQLDVLRKIVKTNPEPWGLANGYKYAQALGVSNRVVSFNYGRIEGEPTFPMTNFGGSNAWEGGGLPGPRGEMGNAQTHSVQLPNTFAFARGATGQPLPQSADYVAFANRLLPGRGEAIVAAWSALGGNDSTVMRRNAAAMHKLASDQLTTGDLKGLLFGDPRRFVSDLVYMLKMRADWVDFVATQRKGGDTKSAIGKLAASGEAWQHQHGYENRWTWPGMEESLRQLNSVGINSVLDDLKKKPGLGGFESVQHHYYQVETFTPRLLDAMREYSR